MGVRRSKVAVLASLVVLAAVVSAVTAAGARADTVVIPAGTPDPWSDPGHQGALERLAATVASAIVGRPVSVRCEDQAAWTALNPNEDPQHVEGFVSEPPHSTTTTVTK